jgi:thiamine biosynthesis lipoprotein ApbE
MRSVVAFGLLLAGCGAPPTPYVARARTAMGAVFSVGAWGGDTARLRRAVDAAVDSVRWIDSLLSPNREASELSRVNRSAGHGPQPISAPFVAVLREALAISRASSGAFDPTGKDYRGVRLDSVRKTVRLRHGLTLELSGIASGYALDRARLALSGTVDSAVLGLGGLLLVMTPGRNVGVSDPANSLGMLARLQLPAGAWAIGTTSMTDVDPVQDPRTGQPAAQARSVTTLARDGLTAAAWSRAFFVLGCDRALVQAPPLGVGVLCVDERTRWTADLDGRVVLTMDSVPAAGTAPVPGRGPVPAPGPAVRGSTTPPASSDSSR